jgi:gliding motility-associated-like protein
MKNIFYSFFTCIFLFFSITTFSKVIVNESSNVLKSKMFFFLPGPTDTICVGDTVTLNASNPFALSYAWSPAYNISNINIPNPKVYPTQTTTYKVIIYGITSNLISNGDFSQGNTGFTSGYTNTTNLWPEATYYIGTNPNTYHANFAVCGDHTTGTGNMMIVNGAAVPNTNIWQKTVAVNPNSMYVFSCWLASVTTSNPAQLQFFVNGIQIGNIFNATSTNCNWNMFYNLWPSGTATTANIAIKNQNSQLSGNDFAIDDLYFAEMVEINDSTKIVVDKPVISLGNDTSICQGDTLKLTPGNGYIQYQWSNGLLTPSINASNTGNYWVKVTTPTGCKTSDTINLTINSLPVITTINDTICKGDTAVLYVSGGSNYLWSTGETTQSINLIPTTTTNYNVIVTSNQGCVDSSFATAFVNQIPTLGITPQHSICEGDSTNLAASGGVFYQWNNGSNSSVINVSPALNTIYNVEVIDLNGCKNDTSTSVNVVTNPISTITSDVDTVCSGNPIVLTATGGNIFHWNTGDNSNSITVYPINNTTYSCTVSNGLNGILCSNTSNYKVYTENCNTLYIPNAFVPNGVNKIFKPVGNFSEDTEYNMVIYNRWGQLIFETKHFEEGWDGTFNGKLVQPGVYIYYFSMKFGGQKAFFEKKGIVTLVE